MSYMAVSGPETFKYDTLAGMQKVAMTGVRTRRPTFPKGVLSPPFRIAASSKNRSISALEWTHEVPRDVSYVPRRLARG